MTDASAFDSAEPFRADGSTLDRARRHAEEAGLTVTAESRLGFTTAGPPAAYEELTGGRIESYEALQRVQGGNVRYVTHLDIVGTGQPSDLGVGTARGADAIEAVVLEQPRSLHHLSPSPQPPNVDKFHLRLPGDVAMLLGATPAHANGDVGAGVTVAMVDTGQYAHTYFTVHGYRVNPTVTLVPGTSPAKDPVGHGTGESANIFAVAPGATLQPYRVSNARGQLTSAVAGFLKAKSGRPQVITNSWGGDLDFPPAGPLPAAYRAWVMEILDAVEQGIVVVFSAGNGQFSVEPQVPGVISAGGVFAGHGLDLRASDYASGYTSPWFRGVVVPTVCGLVGMRPRAQYLMLPIPPGCEIDITESQSSDGQLPDTGDGTRPDDGWALFSGTSAAAPQIAGAAAVLLGARPGLTPAQVATALAKTATDITVGRNHPRYNKSAVRGFDEATGPGLVNVAAALAFVRANF
ncbi:S8 family serine peptidase [Kitasatospora atroaurantiaca]|uniref:S8 family serine peptidase n=1 Tax=Kitasatospora atroaurantiaca TaxID=285545 RepID=UPI001FE7EDDE|nr:S8 family serine peptidase [Kitasatospora atroaurantiaca]